MINKIVLTPEQMSILRQATGPVPVCDPSGIAVGSADPEITPEFIAELKHRSATCKKWYTGEQVHNHLRALEDAWQREGPFDESRMLQILQEARAMDK